MNPRITFSGSITLWIVSDHGRGSSYRVFEGPRTVRAVARALHAEERAGRAAHLELETAACGPVAFDLAELVAIGVVGKLQDEHAIVVAREAMAAEQRGRKRTPRFLVGLARAARGGKWLALLLVALSLGGCGSPPDQGGNSCVLCADNAMYCGDPGRCPDGGQTLPVCGVIPGYSVAAVDCGGRMIDGLHCTTQCEWRLGADASAEILDAGQITIPPGCTLPVDGVPGVCVTNCSECGGTLAVATATAALTMKGGQ